MHPKDKWMQYIHYAIAYLYKNSQALSKVCGLTKKLFLMAIFKSKDNPGEFGAESSRKI